MNISKGMHKMTLYYLPIKIMSHFILPYHTIVKICFMQSASKKCNLCIRAKGHKPMLQLNHLPKLSHNEACIYLIRTQFHSLHKRWKNFVWIKYDYMINTFCFHGHISTHDAEALLMWLRLEKQYYNLYIYHRYLGLLAAHCRKFDIEI